MFAERWHQTVDQDTETTRKPLGTSKENTRGSLKNINFLYFLTFTWEHKVSLYCLSTVVKFIR